MTGDTGFISSGIQSTAGLFWRRQTTFVSCTRLGLLDDLSNKPLLKNSIQQGSRTVQYIHSHITITQISSISQVNRLTLIRNTVTGLNVRFSIQIPRPVKYLVTRYSSAVDGSLPDEPSGKKTTPCRMSAILYSIQDRKHTNNEELRTSAFSCGLCYNTLSI
jgi:hypothetical protein